MNMSRSYSSKSQVPFKNYYQILQLPQMASSSDIQNAYVRLSTKWHPDLFRQNKRQAQIRYNDICQAYQTLSNKIKRQDYDNLFNEQYTIEQATKNFDRFYQQYGYQDENEKKFFEQNYPDRRKHFLDVLQLPKNATYDQINKAYRRLAIKYHPKNNHGNSQTNKKFIQINRAYNSLANSTRKGNFDSFQHREIDPIRTNNPFDDFWKDRDKFFNEQRVIGSPLKRQWSNREWGNGGNWNNAVGWKNDDNWNNGVSWKNDDQWKNGSNWRNDDNWRREVSNWKNDDIWKNDGNWRDDDNFRNCTNGQSIKQSTMTTNNNGVESRKSVISKKVYDNGQTHTITTQQYDNPDGTRQIRKMKDDGRGNVTTDVYKLKKGQNLPIGI